MPPLSQPIAFGRFHLIEQIAVGGMAEIFLAKAFGALGFEKTLVIKRILPHLAQDAEFVRMFVTEAKLVCHLEHPNIVQVYELGEHHGQYYIAMERVSGIDARQLWRTLALRRKRLPGLLALFIVSEFLKGLHHAHCAHGPDGKLLGVVHRDVSPSNILISFRGDVKIGDFGIALVQQESATQAGVLKGKYGYMSPEQVAGMPIDGRSDVFSAGVVLAELLLGRRLFAARNDFETLDRVLNVRLDVLDRHADALPPEVVRIVRKMLDRQPDDRYASAQAAHDEILDFLYQRRERVTNEMLAAFIARHVEPHLGPGGPGLDLTGGVDAGEERAEATRGTRKHGSPSPVVKVGPTLVHDTIVDLALNGKSAAESSAPIPANVTGPAIPALTSDDPMMPLWDNVIATEEDFGAIPELEIDDSWGVSSSARSLAPQPPPSGSDAAKENSDKPGTELDLAAVPATTGDEAEPIAAVPSTSGARVRLISAELVRVVPQPSADRPPDFTGVLDRRSVVKILYRFGVAAETGLLRLTGAPALMDQLGALDGLARVSALTARSMTWIYETQWRIAGREPPADPSRHQTCEFFIDSGQPRLVAADRSEEALVAYLLALQQLDRGSLVSALQANPHRGLVSALIASGSLSPLQVSRHVASYVLHRAMESFHWDEGGFAFYRAAAPPADAFPLSQSWAELITSAADTMPLSALDRYLATHIGDKVIQKRAPVVDLDALNAGPLMRTVYTAIGYGRTMEQFWQQPGVARADPVEVKRSLYLLLECELAELQ